MGYYATWQVGQLAVAEIDWSGLTHVALAFYAPKGKSLVLSNGTLTLPDDLVREVAPMPASAIRLQARRPSPTRAMLERSTRRATW